MKQQTPQPEIRALSKQDIPEGTAVLVASMKNNPNWQILFPDKASRRKAIKVLMQILLNDSVPFGKTYGAFINNKLAGVIVWHPPGTYELTFSRKLKAMPYLFKMMFIIPKHFGNFARFGEKLNKLHPQEPHWYLDAIGIAPEFQRHGLGSKLMNTVLSEIDDKKEDAYLETEIEPNVQWYSKKFRFEVFDEKVQVLPNGLYFYKMLRRNNLFS